MSDGTEAGTRLLTSTLQEPQGSWPEAWVDAEGFALFLGDEGLPGPTLWRSDGTVGGTVRVADLRAGPGGSVPRTLARVGDTVLFSAMDEAAGMEPHALPVPEWVDRSPPILTCPAAVKAWASESTGTSVSYPPATATDLSGTPTVQYSHASGSLFPVGTTQVTVTATDPLGLSRQCTFPVEVTQEHPVEGDPGPFSCDCGAGGTGPVALWSLLALMAGAVRRRRS